MVKKFITYCLLFFIPIVLGYIALEIFTRDLPSSFKANKTYIENNKAVFETVLFGSSQMQSAVNPEWLDTPTLTLASGDQHHDTDFKLLKFFQERLPKLKTIVVEVSYSHFEFPKNGKKFWKNSLYLQFYNVNAFERPTYFKDRLVWLSKPSFFSKKMKELYVDKARKVSYNEFGFNTLNYYGKFKNLEYDQNKIDAITQFKINKTPNLTILKENTKLFDELLHFASEKNLNVIIATVPMYKTYVSQRDAGILRRRDSVITALQNKYSNVVVFDRETDTVSYGISHFWNHSHINPDGAKIYSAQLNDVLQLNH